MGEDALRHLVATGGSATHRSRRVRFDAAAVDIAASAVEPLKGSFDRLADLTLAREARWTARIKATHQRAKARRKGKGRG